MPPPPESGKSASTIRSRFRVNIICGCRCTAFISDETFFLRPDPDTTITDPGNTAAIITTAAYSHQTGGIYLHSSRGFTRTRTIKPDLAAPGRPAPASRLSGGNRNLICRRHDRRSRRDPALLVCLYAISPRINTSIAKHF